MKKNYKKIIGIIIILIIIYFGYTYFNISGSQIEGANQISSNSSASIRKLEWPGGQSQEYELNKGQIEKLKKLIMETDFIRVLDGQVFFDASVHYYISINNKDKKPGVIINSLGGEYISVFDQFNGKYLKIKNQDWEESLEEILSL